MLFIDTIKTYFKSVILLGLIAVLGNPLESSATSLNEELASSSAPAAGSVAGRKVEEAFYIFDVGQGNSQLAIYFDQLGKPFGILYDCGSSAQTVNSKFLQLRSKSTIDELMVFLKRRAPEEDEELGPKGPLRKEKGKKRKSTESGGTSATADTSATFSSMMSSGAAKVRPGTSVSEQIKAVLSQLENLFVVLSHPDRDHINLLKDSMPEKLNVLFILSGNFFRESEAENSEEGNLKTDIKNLFKFMTARKNKREDKIKPSEETRNVRRSTRKTTTRTTVVPPNTESLLSQYGETHVTLPYFWPLEVESEYNPLDYQEIVKLVLSEKDEVIGKRLSDAIQNHTPNFFQGDFKEFLQKIPKIENKNSSFYEQYLTHENLSNIYIWAMNHVSDDINNHSLIMSFCMPSLQKTFICTGDAGHELFQRIEQHIRDKKLLSNDASSSPDASSSVAPPQLKVSEKVDKILYNGQPFDNFTVLLMLPHHGSEENRSLTMLNLFRPHILGISAGAGSLYRHPSEKLIQGYQELYEDYPHLKQRKTEIWKRYALSDSVYRYMSFKLIPLEPAIPVPTISMELDEETEMKKPKKVVATKAKKRSAIPLPAETEEIKKEAVTATSHKSKEEDEGKKSKKERTEPRLKILTPEDDIPILVPNVVGTIYITKDDFFIKYSSLFECGSSFYFIDIKTALFEENQVKVAFLESVNINSDTDKVVIMGPNVNKIEISYDEGTPKNPKPRKKVFQRTVDDPSVFLSEDTIDLLLALDILYKEGAITKTVRKFYWGHKVTLDEKGKK